MAKYLHSTVVYSTMALSNIESWYKPMCNHTIYILHFYSRGTYHGVMPVMGIIATAAAVAAINNKELLL